MTNIYCRHTSKIASSRAPIGKRGSFLAARWKKSNRIGITDEQQPPKRRRSNFLFLLAIIGVAFIWIALLYSEGMPTIHSRRLFFAYFNWNHWPIWYSVNFWIIAAGLSLARIVPKNIARYVQWTSALAVCIVIYLNSIWLIPVRDRLVGIMTVICLFPYQGLFIPFYYEPLTLYMADGTISWRLFAAPVSAILIIVCLLRINHYRKNKGNGDKS